MSTHDSNLKVTPAAKPAPTGTETIRTSIFLPPMLPGQEQGPQLPSALNAPPTVMTLWRAFVRRWPLALGLAVVAGLFVALAVSLIFPPKFVASFNVRINSAKTVNPFIDKNEDPDFAAIKTFQQALVKSRPVILRALETSTNGKFPKDFAIVRAQGDAVDWLQGVKTDFSRAAEILTVTFAADNAEELTLLMNNLARSIVEENRIGEESKYNLLIEQTQVHEREHKKNLEQKYRFLRGRTKDFGDDNVAARKLLLLEDKRRGTLDLLNKAKLEIIIAEQEVKGMEDRLSEGTAEPASQAWVSMLREDPQGQLLLKEVEKRSTDLATAQSRLPDPNSPLLLPYISRKQQADIDIEQYKARNRAAFLQRHREKGAGESEVELGKRRDKLNGLKTQDEFLTAEVLKLDDEISQQRPNVAVPPDVIAMRQEIDTLEKAQATISSTIALMRANVPQSRVSLLQEAIEPSVKDSSRMNKMAGVGGLGAFVLCLLGVSFLEFRSRKVSCGDELSRGLGLSLIGSVPALPDKARSPLGHGKLDPYWQNQLMESVDTIRTMLLHNARADNTRVIMISSAVTGEGKTSLASQLAASLARAWKKTLLIDGDLRSPANHRLFDVPQDPGFSEVLRGELSATEAVRSTPLSRLWLMPAGHWDAHAVQALAQDNVRTMLEELKQQFDFIILDSSPILPVADALLLGQNVDGVLLTVMRDLSRCPAVHAAQQRLESLGIKTLGAVLIGAKNELGPLGYKYVRQARP